MQFFKSKKQRTPEERHAAATQELARAKAACCDTEQQLDVNTTAETLDAVKQSADALRAAELLVASTKRVLDQSIAEREAAEKAAKKARVRELEQQLTRDAGLAAVEELSQHEAELLTQVADSPLQREQIADEFERKQRELKSLLRDLGELTEPGIRVVEGRGISFTAIAYGAAQAAMSTSRVTELLRAEMDRSGPTSRKRAFLKGLIPSTPSFQPER